MQEPAEPDPAKAGEIDVAKYINSLRSWGRTGWTRYESLKSWALKPLTASEVNSRKSN